jgi:predicted nucleic-acid-binding protein
MIGIDTNVLLRFLIDDEPSQGAAARRFLSERSAEDPAYVSVVVIAETVWFLIRHLGHPKSRIVETLGLLIETDELLVEHSHELKQYVADPNQLKADIADYLIAWAALKSGCRKTMTFDKQAAARVPGMELLA